MVPPGIGDHWLARIWVAWPIPGRDVGLVHPPAVLVEQILVSQPGERHAEGAIGMHATAEIVPDFAVEDHAGDVIVADRGGSAHEPPAPHDDGDRSGAVRRRVRT